MKLFEKFNSKKDELSDLDNEILKYILNNKKRILELNLNDIAIENNVSKPMINKVLKKVGLTGLKELKLKISTEIYLEEIFSNDKQSDFLLEQNIYINNIIDTTNNLKVENLETISRAILSVSQNLIWAEGFMGWVSKDFQRKANKILIPFRTLTDLENIKYVDMTKKTNLFIISASGTTQTIDRVIEIFRNEISELKIFAITSSNIFKWKEQVDLHIHGSFTPFIDIYEKEVPTASRMIICYILDILFRKLFFLNYQKNIEHIKKISKFY